MPDCANVTIRELLPDLMHQRLSPDVEAEVRAHLATCDDCTEELALLEAVRMLASSGPRLDVAGIVRALPHPVAATPRRRIPWRLAASITLLALGGTTVATAVRSIGGADAVGDTVIVADTPAVVATVDSPRATPVVPKVSPVNLTAGGDLTDLADEDLELLIGALDRIEAVPLAEPEGSRLSRLVTGATGGA